MIKLNKGQKIAGFIFAGLGWLLIIFNVYIIFKNYICKVEVDMPFLVNIGPNFAAVVIMALFNPIFIIGICLIIIGNRKISADREKNKSK